jgi:hypothetical protein
LWRAARVRLPELRSRGYSRQEILYRLGTLQAGASPAYAAARFGSPEAYTPKHLAEKILTSRAALEGERKQVTVLFADLKGSMELLTERDPEDARTILDTVLERMMEGCAPLRGHREPWPSRASFRAWSNAYVSRSR